MAYLESGFSKGRIILNSKNESYFSGQIVSGTIEFKLDAPLTITTIYVRFLGEAVVHWTEYESEEYNGRSRTYEVNYNGREEYFNFIQYVAGRYQGPPVTLPPGTHSYPFQYQTPYVCPSSFEGSRGKVWYKVLANLECPGMQPNPDTEIVKIFQMVAPLNLNDDTPAKNPINLEFEEVYSCCFCESEPLVVQVKVPYSGYCPGQKVPIEVRVDNKSNIEVEKMVFTLLKSVAYHSQQPQSDYEMPDEVIAKVKKGAIPSATKRNFTVDLEVPDMIAPNLDNCMVIDTGYSFKVEIEVSGCNDGTEDEADFVIGLIPIHGTQENYVHPMKDSLPSGPIPQLTTVYPSNTPYPTPETATNVMQSESSYTKPIGFVTDPTQIRYPGYPYPGMNDTLPPPYTPYLPNTGFGSSAYPPEITPTAPSAPPC